MSNVKTSLDAQNQPSCLGAVMCRLFHPIETLENCSFVDSVSGKSVGKFRCKKCNVEYLANGKRDMFRCYV
jgi:hypothetical protein